MVVNSSKSKSKFVFPKVREKLYHKIKGLGLYVRMHGYEYLIADDKRILALLFLEPWTNRAELRIFVSGGEFVEKIVSKVKSLDPSVSMEVLYLSSTSDRSHFR